MSIKSLWSKPRIDLRDRTRWIFELVTQDEVHRSRFLRPSGRLLEPFVEWAEVFFRCFFPASRFLGNTRVGVFSEALSLPSSAFVADRWNILATEPTTCPMPRAAAFKGDSR
jgi:hypothetical protein